MTLQSQCDVCSRVLDEDNLAHHPDKLNPRVHCEYCHRVAEPWYTRLVIWLFF